MIWLHWVHLVAAAVWTGGLITLGALVPTLRKAGCDRSILRATARRFAVVSWAAMAVSVATGLMQVWLLHLPWTYGRLHIKLGVVAAAVALALIHQLTARRSSAAVRGAVQGLILLFSLGIFAAAAHL